MQFEQALALLQKYYQDNADLFDSFQDAVDSFDGNLDLFTAEYQLAYKIYTGV